MYLTSPTCRGTVLGGITDPLLLSCIIFINPANLPTYDDRNSCQNVVRERLPQQLHHSLDQRGKEARLVPQLLTDVPHGSLENSPEDIAS